jgi:oligopeptide/dipeptide ABC transporter ATP-binding protein
MSPMLRVDHLTVEFASMHRAKRRERFVAVDDATFQVERGECVGIVGESGSGKSTIARTIAGLIVPVSGTIHLDGEVLSQTKRPPAVRRRIQMVFQDPNSSLDPRLTVRRAIAEVLEVHDLVPRDGVAARVEELLALVGLAGRADARPAQLSGGQRQRVAIARALAAEPDVLIADEAVSALDVSVKAAIINLLRDLRERLQLTMVFISHDLAVMSSICDRVVVMYRGRIVEESPTVALFADARHPYTQALLASIPRVGAPLGPRPDPIADLPTGSPVDPSCRYAPRCPSRVEQCLHDIPLLIGGSHRVACHLAPPEPTAAAPDGEAPTEPGTPAS